MPIAASANAQYLPRLPSRNGVIEPGAQTSSTYGEDGDGDQRAVGVDHT